MRRILIVEDEFTIALDLKRFLMRDHENQAVIASNYAQAMDLLESFTPHICLIDINLNDNKNGIDIGTFVHQNLDIPFMYVTAYTDENTFQQALSTFPVGFINKPIDFVQLSRQIEIIWANAAQQNERIRELHAELLQNQSRMQHALDQESATSELLRSLSNREMEVMMFLADGLTDQQLADKLFISVTTIRTHLRRIYDKLLVTNRTEAVAILHKINYF